MGRAEASVGAGQKESACGRVMTEEMGEGPEQNTYEQVQGIVTWESCEHTDRQTRLKTSSFHKRTDSYEVTRFVSSYLLPDLTSMMCTTF